MNLARLHGLLSTVKETLIPLLRENQYAVVLGLVYLVAWSTPAVWMREAWLTSNATLSAQPFILLGFLALLWSRAKLSSSDPALEYWSAVFPKAQQKEGNLSLFLLGCALYFFAHFVRLSSAAILGLVLMLLGIFFRIYGKGFFRRNLAPICFLFLIVPAIPESGVFAIDQLGLKLYSGAISALLNRIGWNFQINLQSVTVQGVSITTPLSFRGLYGIYAGLLFFTWQGLFLKQKITSIISRMTLVLVVMAIFSLIRCALVVILIPHSSGMAKIIANANPLLIIAIILWLTIKLMSKLEKIQFLSFGSPLIERFKALNAAINRPLNRKLDGSGAVFTKIGGLVNIILMPIVWPLNMIVRGVELLFNGMGKSTQNIEKWIQKQERRRRRQREERKR